jgi:hypothetical protein
MPNWTGLRNRFFKTPNAAKANANLETNVRAFVNGYLRNRNTPNKVPPLNTAMANALHKYINVKRARKAGVVAAAVENANASKPVAAAAGVAAGNVPSNATPAAAGNKVANAVTNAGGNATQAAAAAAAAAKQQAVNQGKPANVANGLAAAAAAKAANANTPNAAAAAALTGAQAANLPVPVAANAANMAYLNSLGNTLSINNIQKVQQIVNEPFASNALKAKALNVLKRVQKPNERKNLLKTLTNLNTNAQVNARIKAIRGQNPNANWKNVNANGLTNGQKKVLNGLKLGQNYVGLKRQATPAGNVNVSSLFASTQAPPAPARQAPPPPSKN